MIGIDWLDEYGIHGINIRLSSSTEEDTYDL